MRAGYFQFCPRFGEPQANLDQLERGLNDVRADLVVAPELALSGYLFRHREEVERLAEPIPGPATDRLQQVARRAGCHLVIGLAERAGDKLYNSAALIGPGGVLGVYRKVHLFNDEKLYFTPGNDGLRVCEVAGVRIGLLVCFDHMFPEAARTLALEGAEVICHPSNLVLPEYGQLTSRVRSIENRVFWILANRHGTERRSDMTLRYTGCSQITAFNGEVLARAADRGDNLTIVEIDPARARSKKVGERNDLFADRRPSLYRLG